MARIPSEAAIKLGDQIRQHRIALEYSQQKLGGLAQVEASNIGAYENGYSLPNVFTLVRIADALGVKPGDLLDELTPEMFPAHGNTGSIGR